MGRKKLSGSEKIRRYMAAHPKAKPREVAAALEIDVRLVYAVRLATKNKAKADTFFSVNPMQKVDEVNHPPHYTQGGIETIDFIRAKLTREEFIGYLKGNAIKYSSRIGKKGSASTDAGKMAWYTNRLWSVLKSTDAQA